MRIKAHPNGSPSDFVHGNGMKIMRKSPKFFVVSARERERERERYTARVRVRVLLVACVFW